MFSYRYRGSFLVILGLTLSLCGFQAEAQKTSHTELSIGLYTIRAEIAATPAARTQGLMYRQFLPDDDGMLFVFEDKAFHCFWMRNTRIPLSIAFIADDGKIVNIEDMQAMTETNHCPHQAIRYALEMNRGWFAKKGIGPKHRVVGLPK